MKQPRRFEWGSSAQRLKRPNEARDQRPLTSTRVAAGEVWKSSEIELEFRSFGIVSAHYWIRRKRDPLRSFGGAAIGVNSCPFRVVSESHSRMPRAAQSGD